MTKPTSDEQTVCIRRWWLAPLLTTIWCGVFLHYFEPIMQWLPSWLAITVGSVTFSLLMCLGPIWSASTNSNPLLPDNVKCRRHAWWYNPRFGCEYCRDEAQQTKIEKKL